MVVGRLLRHGRVGLPPGIQITTLRVFSFRMADSALADLNARSGTLPVVLVYCSTFSGAVWLLRQRIVTVWAKIARSSLNNRGTLPANTGTIRAGTLDQLNDYCSARGRAKFIADWLPGGGTIARDLWGSYLGDKLGFYQLSVADLNRITEENDGGETVAMHAASEAAKAGAASTSFLYALRAKTGIPMSLASKWLGRASADLLLFDAGKGFYKEGREILNCQAGN
jgi:hypothetical protein